MRVRIYRNLRTGTLSLQKKTKKGWRVFDHRYYVSLSNCKFTVQPAGSLRCKKEGIKNVHAWVEGDLDSDSMVPVYENKAFYNPKKDNCWRTMGGIKITAADKVSVLHSGTVTYSYDENKCSKCGKENDDQ